MDERVNKAASNYYSRVNRSEWGAEGFRSITAKVHDLDRELVLAYVEFKRWERLKAFADAGDKLAFIMARKQQKSPSMGEYIAIENSIEELSGKFKAFANGLLSEAHALTKAAGEYNQQVLANPTDAHADAQSIACSGLAVATLRYAEAYIAQHETLTSSGRVNVNMNIDK